ncbi:uncharacterized protein BDZ99DRAFT_536128 [Mytilinidion resinicola]|uniref:Uncharacterized protein n=1 Tax=Mytilinidion resinicola TaxID=574789 RepID=A0A6A6YJE6_9PEZI|nr:uncharacterized protein BDZ99DRAFT_536128 [Mytilinidion resinicola]KAF2808114.1 hypothetical protein BDZ99DRAFT_536128 [Mytilinidion resinicola]
MQGSSEEAFRTTTCERKSQEEANRDNRHFGTQDHTNAWFWVWPSAADSTPRSVTGPWRGLVYLSLDYIHLALSSPGRSRDADPDPDFATGSQWFLSCSRAAPVFQIAASPGALQIWQSNIHSRAYEIFVLFCCSTVHLYKDPPNASPAPRPPPARPRCRCALGKPVEALGAATARPGRRHWAIGQGTAIQTDARLIRSPKSKGLQDLYDAAGATPRRRGKLQLA